jgi:site-specific DNA recombinase
MADAGPTGHGEGPGGPEAAVSSSAVPPVPRVSGPCSTGGQTTRCCGRRMESAWSNGKPAYRCRHGRTSAMAPDPARPKNIYVREDKLMPHLPALHLLLTSTATRARRRTRAGTDVRPAASPEQVIGYLREHEITITWDPAAATLQARATETAKTVTVKTS